MTLAASLGESLASLLLAFGRKVFDLLALRLAALAVHGGVLLVRPAVAAPALAGVDLLLHHGFLLSLPDAVVLLPCLREVHAGWRAPRRRRNGFQRIESGLEELDRVRDVRHQRRLCMVGETPLGRGVRGPFPLAVIPP